MAQTKQQKEIFALVVLAVIAGLVWYGYFGRNRVSTGTFFASGPYTPINAEDYGKPLEDLKKARETEYKPSGRNIFVAAPPALTPSPSAVAAEAPKQTRLPVGPPLPPEPPPPVLSMKFYGFGTLPSYGPRRAFLLDGEEVRIVGEGDTIQNHIRITHIGNDRIEYEDVNTGKKNSTNLEMPPPA
ncbi:MAG TPA: hypothetical protein VED66_13290 [Candidatus Sulfotelmatobacter sp.]|nr:hypothetical protein [Candidatus Sulfotelmatobacter sp.]